MANLTAARNTKEYGEDLWPRLFSYTLPASQLIYPGSMVALDVNGRAVNAGSANAKTVVGVYRGTFNAQDTTGTNDATLCQPVRAGAFYLANSSGADAVAQKDVGSYCYVVDDQTVARNDNNGVRIFCGLVLGIDANDGVLVLIMPELQNPVGVLAIPIPNYTLIANAATLWTWTAGFQGRVTRTSLTNTTVATGAGATATLTPDIAGIPLTGGVLTPTLANQTPLGAEIAGTAVTALNLFQKGQALHLVASAVTAFTAGSGVAYLHLG